LLDKQGQYVQLVDSYQVWLLKKWQKNPHHLEDYSKWQGFLSYNRLTRR
jgi:hypothetical protein